MINGDTSSPCALIANPGADGISLREALLAANNATGSGVVTITFASALAGATITLTERFAPITRNQITLTGLTSNGQSNITVDATHASNPGPILFLAASYFAMSGLNFPSIPTNFHGIQIGGFYFDSMGNMVSSPAQLCCVQITGNAFSNGTTGFAVYVPTSDSNETISDVTIASNTFSQLYEAINIQGGGLPNNASNSVIEDVVVFGNSFSQITPYAGVEVGNTAGSGNQVLRTQILQNNFSNSQQGVELDSTLGAQNSVVRDTLIARNVFVAVIDPALRIAGGTDGGAKNNTIANTPIVNNVISQAPNAVNSGEILIIDNQGGQEINNKVSGVSIVNNTFAGAFNYGAIGVVSTGDVSGVAVLNTIFFNSIPYGNPVVGLTPSQMSYSIINQSGFHGSQPQLQRRSAVRERLRRQFRTAIRQSGPPRRHHRRGAGHRRRLPAARSPPSIGAYEFEGPNICSSTNDAPLTATPTSASAPLAVTFTASGLALPMTYTVSFGDGTTGALTQTVASASPRS